MSSLMMVASVSLVVPTATTFDPDSHGVGYDRVLILSHYTAIILLILFVIYLYFQLKTHADLYILDRIDRSVINEERNNRNIAREEQRPILGPWAAGFVLITSTLCVIICASYLVDNIEGLDKATDFGEPFIGLVLIPTMGNAAKCVIAIATSRSNRTDLAVRISVGSVLQIALFVAPLLVLLGWILEKPMTLGFDSFEAVIFFLAVMVVACLIQDGRTNYFEGAMLIGT
jgi:Ca2+:H+ antiporter